MEHTLEVLMLGFCTLVFVMSISLVVLMYSHLDNLYSNAKNHVNIKSVLESDILGR